MLRDVRSRSNYRAQRPVPVYPVLGRALGRGGPRPSLLLPFNHPHDPLLRQVAAWIAYPQANALSS